jgi:hypothetical protein
MESLEEEKLINSFFIKSGQMIANLYKKIWNIITSDGNKKLKQYNIDPRNTTKEYFFKNSNKDGNKQFHALIVDVFIIDLKINYEDEYLKLVLFKNTRNKEFHPTKYDLFDVLKAEVEEATSRFDDEIWHEFLNIFNIIEKHKDFMVDVDLTDINQITNKKNKKLNLKKLNQIKINFKKIFNK